MTSKKSLATSLLSLSTGLLLTLSAAGGATASPRTPQESDGPRIASTTVASLTAASYWTSDRMRSAIPGDVLAEKAAARQINKGKTLDGITDRGSSTKIAGTSGRTKTTALHTNEKPVNHIGKVFFTLNGLNYVCSGSSVTAANKSTVSTAGHCLNAGPGAFASNFIFVPAYKDGAAPLGKWPAKALFAPKEWTASGNMQYDTGFAVVEKVGAKNLADVAGAVGVAFSQPRGLTYKAFGYPAATPFTGQTLVSCYGKAGNDAINPQFKTQGIPCDMTGGASGGPWLLQNGASTQVGYQNSVNSYGYGSRSTAMYGPYWGAIIQQVYNRASAAA
ncbi:trypsin-like serine peptidase [Arthrobacter sp. NPDC093125]|jgi:V8-like Glu-specific endopeptidase|uniref:trypsin-like serine peptidase n=1 Tax=Arthrobacter sp. NPDC093125 TaxID=3363944 RepID=UPI0038263CDB